MRTVLGGILVLFDILFLIFSVILVSSISFLMLWGQVGLILINLVSFYSFRLYDFKRINKTEHLIGNIIASIGFSVVVTVLVFFIPRLVLEEISRKALLYESLLVFSYLYISRKIASGFAGNVPMRIMTVNTPVLELDYCVYSSVSQEGNINFDSIKDEISEFKPDMVVIPDGSNVENINILPVEIAVISAEQLMEKFSMKVKLDSFRLEDLYSNPFSPWYSNIKSMLEWVIALVLTVISSPLVLIGVLLVLINDPGNPFFLQERLGKNGKVFKIIKIRTMRKNGNHSEWTKDGDDRILKVGKFLRKVRFDELPQFWNVLKGDMAVVGPRPETPEIAAKLTEEIPLYPLRLKVKPGISGWAQLNWGYDRCIEDVKEKVSYDLYYIKNRSMVFDLRIMLQTIETMLLGRGAR